MRNDTIQEMVEVVDAWKIAQKRRLYWYGRVMQRGESGFKDHAGPPSGWHRPKTRLKRRWRDCVGEDMGKK